MWSAISSAIVGAAAGLVTSAITGVIIGVTGSLLYHSILVLTIDNPSAESLGILFSVVVGVVMGLLVGVPIGPIVGAVVGPIAGTRRLTDVVIAAASGTFAGALAGVAAVVADSFLGSYGIHFLSYVTTYSLLTGVLFNTAVGVMAGIGTGLYIGRTNRNLTFERPR